MPVYSLDAIVVTATRTENTLEKVPASTQVITSEDIKRGASTNVRDVLSTYANIFQKNHSHGGGHDVVIRGMNTEHSLIMIDGRRVANEADGSGLGNANALDRINISDVEKIEIVKGPSSALYGSEAMGGVINIITKPSTEQTILTGLEFTRDDKSHWWHLDTGRQGKISATVDARFNKTKRDVMEPGDTTSNDYGTSQNYNASLNYYINDNNYFNFYGSYYSQHLKNDSGTPTLKDISVSRPGITVPGKAMIDGETLKTYKQKNYGMSWNGKTDKNQWQIQTYFSQFQWGSNRNKTILQAFSIHPMMNRMYNALLKLDYGNDFDKDENKMWAIEGRDTMKIGDHHRVTFGSEYVRNKVSGTGLGANGDNIHDVTINGKTKSGSEKVIETYAAYVQDEIEFGKWFIVPAVRYDHHNFYGSHSSPKIGVTYSATDHFRVKANYGKAFKAPSVSRLYYDLDTQMGSKYNHIIGNPNLKPEESKSWDLGFETEFGKGYASLTYFDNDVTNLISTGGKPIGVDSNNHDLYQYTNVGTARIKGIENTLGYRFNDVLDFKVTSTWLDAKDTTNNTKLPQRAKLSQIYALNYDDHKETGWSAMLWDQFDYDYVPIDGRSERSYNLVNFSLTRKVNKNTRVYGQIENIFDKVDESSDIDGRFWAFGWEHKF